MNGNDGSQQAKSSADRGLLGKCRNLRSDRHRLYHLGIGEGAERLTDISVAGWVRWRYCRGRTMGVRHRRLSRIDWTRARMADHDTGISNPSVDADIVRLYGLTKIRTLRRIFAPPFAKGMDGSMRLADAYGSLDDYSVSVLRSRHSAGRLKSAIAANSF